MKFYLSFPDKEVLFEQKTQSMDQVKDWVRSSLLREFSKQVFLLQKILDDWFGLIDLFLEILLHGLGVVKDHLTVKLKQFNLKIRVNEDLESEVKGL